MKKIYNDEGEVAKEKARDRENRGTVEETKNRKIYE